jgi:hypothetical protein
MTILASPAFEDRNEFSVVFTEDRSGLRSDCSAPAESSLLLRTVAE